MFNALYGLKETYSNIREYVTRHNNYTNTEISQSHNSTELPNDTICHIFNFLSLKTLSIVSLTCKQWKQLSEDSAVDLAKFLKFAKSLTYVEKIPLSYMKFSNMDVTDSSIFIYEKQTLRYDRLNLNASSPETIPFFGKPNKSSNHHYYESSNHCYFFNHENAKSIISIVDKEKKIEVGKICIANALQPIENKQVETSLSVVLCKLLSDTELVVVYNKVIAHWDIKDPSQPECTYYKLMDKNITEALIQKNLLILHESKNQVILYDLQKREVALEKPVDTKGFSKVIYSNQDSFLIQENMQVISYTVHESVLKENWRFVDSQRIVVRGMSKKWTLIMSNLTNYDFHILNTQNGKTVFSATSPTASVKLYDDMLLLTSSEEEKMTFFHIPTQQKISFYPFKEDLQNSGLFSLFTKKNEREVKSTFIHNNQLFTIQDVNKMQSLVSYGNNALK